jgi:hypothetical protein
MEGFGTFLDVRLWIIASSLLDRGVSQREMVFSFQSIIGRVADKKGHPKSMSSLADRAVTLNFPIIIRLSILIISWQYLVTFPLLEWLPSAVEIWKGFVRA